MEAMPLGEHFKVGKARHGAIVFRDLADDSGRGKASKPGKIDSSLSVPCGQSVP